MELKVKNIVKKFSSTVAVNDASFKIEKTKKLPKKLNLNIENLNNEKMT